jgi:putative spermidine/putrescine transport system permease protein
MTIVRPETQRQRLTSLRMLSVLPFVALFAIFLLWPTLTVVYRSLMSTGALSFEQWIRAISGPYRDAFIASIQLSAITAVLGLVLGTALAISIRGVSESSPIRSFAESWSAVASQQGGVPLAFAFIALLGNQGLLTRILNELGLDIIDAGFSISNFWGWVVVYLYFQIPLMFLVVLPAVLSLKNSWFEGAETLGASRMRAWLSVGFPILLPTLLTGFLLLFVNAFAAYATVYALSSQSGSLVPLQIRFILQGNIITGENDLGYSLVTVSIFLLLGMFVVVQIVQRRFSRWARS